MDTELPIATCGACGGVDTKSGQTNETKMETNSNVQQRRTFSASSLLDMNTKTGIGIDLYHDPHYGVLRPCQFHTVNGNAVMIDGVMVWGGVVRLIFILL